ncbi:CoA-transferase [Pseudonocardia xishanensis]|uniref:CoA-transferase subunit beta n=1 Tax=Pseudonocardia xishanensis TaxID=630995 RepID=A0ABP8RL19_9PSEU
MTAGTSPMMLLAAARLLRGGICVSDPGAPTAAALLARATHAPSLELLDPRTPGFLRHGLRRVEVGLVTAAQVDAYGNLNTSVLGEYDEPTERLTGAGILPELAAGAALVVLLPHRLRSFVERVDFVTAAGGLSGPLDRARVGLFGTGPVAVVTDLGVLRPDPATAELVLTDLHPGVTVEQVRAETGWPLEVSDELVATEPATDAERAALTGSGP